MPEVSIPDGVVMTRVTAQVVALAARLGLDPQVRDAYRGAVEVHINGHGADSPFGMITVGARSGRILRASIRYGNNGANRTYTGAVEVRQALLVLRDLPPV